MWRTLLRQRSISVFDCFAPSSAKTIFGCQRLFSTDFAATTSKKLHTEASQQSSSRSRLPVEIGRFYALDREHREKATGKFNAYKDVLDVQKRASTFTANDWREFMNAIVATGIRRGRIYFASNPLESMTEIVSHLANFTQEFDPNDFCNFIRLLLNFEYGFSNWNDLPVHIQNSVCQWFMKNFHQLESDAFFEILLVKTQWLEERFSLAIEPVEDILKFLEHGVNIASKSSDISASLRMLHMIECYKEIVEREKLTPLANRLVSTLTHNVQPQSQRDLCSSLKFVAGPQHRDMTVKKMKKMIKSQDVFQHYVCGSKIHAIRQAPKGAWQWLRNFIEMTFDSDEFDHLRQLAAFAAVDAFKYKAIPFTTDELAGFLIVAAKPFITNPTVVLEPTRRDVASVPRTIALKLLLAAICRGLVESKDSRLRDLLTSSSTCFDNAYWDRFWNMLLKEAPKRLQPDHRRLVLTPLSELNRAFHSGETVRLHHRDRNILRKPLDHSSRRYLLRCLTEPDPHKV